MFLRRRRLAVTSSRPQGTDIRQEYPQKFGRFLAKPFIHKPRTVPILEKNRTSVANCTNRRNVSDAASYIGVSLPEQAEGSGLAPDNAPTRVNVASRFLGNKACEYGTTGASASNLSNKQYT